MDTIFARTGGMSAVSRIVADAYDRVLKSRQLLLYFRQADMRRLMEHQATFLAMAMGGPNSVTDAQLELAHSNLHITDTAFDELMKQFQAALAGC